MAGGGSKSAPFGLPDRQRPNARASAIQSMGEGASKLRAPLRPSPATSSTWQKRAEKRFGPLRLIPASGCSTSRPWWPASPTAAAAPPQSWPALRPSSARCSCRRGTCSAAGQPRSYCGRAGPCASGRRRGRDAWQLWPPHVPSCAPSRPWPSRRGVPARI